MKYFIAFALLAAVASASILPPAVIASTNPEVQEILASIQSSSTDPATAAALEQLLLEVLGLAKPEPIQVGPAIVDEYEPIHVGPAIVPFPIPDGGDLTEVDAVPVVPAPSANPPLVQIILNINAATNVPGAPVVVETIPPAPTPVQVVDEVAVPEPVIVSPIVPAPVVVAPVAPEPVLVADPVIVAPEPVLVAPEPVLVAPEPVLVAPEPVLVAPINPSPAVVLPDTLN